MKQSAEGNLPYFQVVDFRSQKAFNGIAVDKIPDCRQGNILESVFFPISVSFKTQKLNVKIGCAWFSI